MRTKVTTALLLASTGMTLWMSLSLHAPLHQVMSHYDTLDMVKQAALAACAVCLSFGIGRMFR